MSEELNQEQNNDLNAWWQKQSFAGKELFKLTETGDLTLLANSNIRERVIANISFESKDIVLKNLLEKFAAVESKVRELEVEWIAAEDKQRLAEKVAQMKEYMGHAEAAGDFLKLALLVHDWEHTLYTITEENHAAKVALAEFAEGLAGSEEWKETAQAFKDLADKWKHTGYLDKSRNEKLWNRIEAARKAFMDRKRLHHEDEEKNMLLNLDLKIDLVEQAEAIAASEEWKKTSDTYQRLTEEWKTIGHTVNKKNEELWQRFQAAKAAFFDRKREHSQKIKVEHEQNYATKLAIVERAEALKDSTEWNAGSVAYAAMMEEWKKTGRVSHEKGDELWKRFTEAQDVFFQAKKQHFGAIKSNLENNYNLKKALYDRAEKLKHSSRWKDATDEMIQLLEDWKKIGPIPRSHGDKMWEDFNAARKFFFNRKDESRDQRKQFEESQKVVRAEQAKGMVKKLLDDIKEEEEKLADFRNAIENITPGKKAAEMRALLENLIEESTAKLEQLKKKYAQGQADMKAGAAKQAKEQAAENAGKPKDAPAEDKPSEASVPVAETSEPATETSEPVAAASEPVTERNEPVTAASEPVTAEADSDENSDRVQG